MHDMVCSSFQAMAHAVVSCTRVDLGNVKCALGQEIAFLVATLFFLRLQWTPGKQTSCLGRRNTAVAETWKATLSAWNLLLQFCCLKDKSTRCVIFVIYTFGRNWN
ncbi:hypothetical protein AC1031_009931 [Aphanomyces cochlioides]|nr:hypothetical protein AC1031_009931 [Aphanomyces cochlioides]